MEWDKGKAFTLTLIILNLLENTKIIKETKENIYSQTMTNMRVNGKTASKLAMQHILGTKQVDIILVTGRMV